MITGIICEYNPLHLGHKKQLDMVRSMDPDGMIVCLMSGNYVQRGKPAIFDKITRAKAAIVSGADLVLELPIVYALSSAEGFAAGAVSILGKFCDQLCFGAETADPNMLMQIAEVLLSDSFQTHLHAQLEQGLSFPAARQAALQQMGVDATALSMPNNILAVEYCKAIISQNSKMKPMVIHRQGDYHDQTPDANNPSATALRSMIQACSNWHDYVPAEAAACFENVNIHTIEMGESAILAKLRTMSEEEFEALPYGSEGLWRKLMHASRKYATLEEILTAVKSKRYTRTRLDRMVMCAFLGLTQEVLQTPAPYVRVLALSSKGRPVLKAARQTGAFLNIGQADEHPFYQTEQRTTALYGLFAQVPEPPTAESNYRIYCHQ